MKIKRIIEILKEYPQDEDISLESEFSDICWGLEAEDARRKKRVPVEDIEKFLNEYVEK